MADKRASFLVRIWQEPQADDEGAELQWRASVEFTHSQEKHDFQDMESLMAFLSSIVEGFEQPEMELQRVMA